MDTKLLGSPVSLGGDGVGYTAYLLLPVFSGLGGGGGGFFFTSGYTVEFPNSSSGIFPFIK